jgi:hypothetical protein
MQYLKCTLEKVILVNLGNGVKIWHIRERKTSLPLHLHHRKGKGIGEESAEEKEEKEE